MNDPATGRGAGDEHVTWAYGLVAGTEGIDMYDDDHREVAAARLRPDGTLLTILYADGGSKSASPVDSAAAAEMAIALGLTPGGTSTDGVRHWWR